jgi:hypothetical protein
MDLEQIGVENIHSKWTAELIQLQAQYEVGIFACKIYKI